MSSLRHRPWLIAALICVVVLVTAWLVIPWEWSTIDDPGFVHSIQDSLADRGVLATLLQSFQGMANADLDWGLFRPSYWAYPGWFYLLPVGVAHAVRLLMLLIAIIGPLLFFARRGTRGLPLAASAAIIVTGSTGLFVGLAFLSLQELSGAALVGLGLLVRREVPRIVLWTLAAWFKAPFAWLLVGYAIVLWRQGRRRAAILSAGLGFGTIALAAVFAANGSYTTRFYRTTIGLISDAVLGNGPKFFEAPTWVLLAVFVWWWLVSGSRLRFSAVSAALLIATVGYAVNLLPWTVSGYYAGPVLYLSSIFLTSLLPTDIPAGRARAFAALALPVLLAVVMAGRALVQVFTTNAAIVAARECLLSLPAGSQVRMTGTLTYVATLEGADRLEEMARLTDPQWTGSVEYVDPATAEVGERPLLWIGTDPPTATATRSCQSATTVLLSAP